MNKRAALAVACCFLSYTVYLSGSDLNGYLKRRFGGDEIQVREVQGLRQRVQNGKLALHLRDFIELMLKNSPDVQITRLDVYTQADRITAAENPFDPLVSGAFTSERAVTPSIVGGGFSGSGSSFSSGEGGFVALPLTISSLTQQTTLSYQQLLPTGQTFETNLNAIRSSGNEYPDPDNFASLNFILTQPLLQNWTNLQYRAPLINARRQLVISSELDEANIADDVAQGAEQYWQAVEDREAIRVEQQAYELAQKSYDHDKQALDLGALASLDIYQSQAQVASSKSQLVGAQHQYQIALDGLRHLIGADLTPDLRAVELVLDDDPKQIPPKSGVLPFEDALKKANEARPEVKAASQQLEVDALNTRAAKDALKPQLNLQVLGGSSGPSINSSGATVAFPGMGQALRQVLGFDFPSYGGGLQLNFPIHNRSAQAALSDALVNRAQDRYRQRQTQEKVTQDVRTALDNLELADALIDTATTARDLALKNVDAEQQKFQLGSITAFEVVDSQNKLATAESQLVSAYVNYQLAYVLYQRATWTLLDGFGVIIQHP